jgi:hypothetical protein
MDDTTTGPCPRCEELRADFVTKRALMAQLTDEARSEVVRLTAEVNRLRAQLRDEERENGALRRRLREGGR